MLKAGRITSQPGTRTRCVVTSYTRDEIFGIMKENGRAFVLKTVEWDSVTGEAILHLEPGNGVDWEYDLTRVE